MGTRSARSGKCPPDALSFFSNRIADLKLGSVEIGLQVQQFVLLYPPQGETRPNRVSTVLSKQTLVLQSLAQTVGLDQLHITQRGRSEEHTSELQSRQYLVC